MQIEEGAIFTGKVTGLTDFGAFVELEGGKTGMVHISEVSTSYVKDIKEFLTIGQEVRVMVVAVSPEGKVSLSIKRLMEKEEKSAQRPSFDKPRQPRPRQGERRSSPPVWNGMKSNAPAPGEKQSFEDMMARFKQASDEKMADLKHSNESKRGGYSRRGGNKQ